MKNLRAYVHHRMINLETRSDGLDWEGLPL